MYGLYSSIDIIHLYNIHYELLNINSWFIVVIGRLVNLFFNNNTVECQSNKLLFKILKRTKNIQNK